MLAFTIKLFRTLNTVHILNRAKTSALYITGEKANETFAILTPYIDFDERIKNKIELERNLELRNVDVNLEEIIKLWNFYQEIKAKKVGLEESKVSISQTIKSLSLKGDRYAERIDTLKAHGKMVKEDLKVLKEAFWSVEEKAALKALSVPNILHEDTPHKEATTVYEYYGKGLGNLKFHLDIAKDLDLVEYNNPSYYFLKNDAALFELASTFYLTDELLNRNYVQFSNSDFARSVIVEGCGIEYFNPTKVFTVSETNEDQENINSSLHLVGGASLVSFMAYHAKHTVFPSQLPFKYFTIGRKYNPVISNNNSLLNVTQETAVEIFVATKDEQQEMNQIFQEVLKDVTKIYQSLGYHFKICYASAKDLNNWESLRASIQMYSHYLEDYVEIGNVSISDNFISKRLLFNYGRGYDLNFPKIISGTLYSVPKILACILEYDNFELLPKNFKKYVP